MQIACLTRSRFLALSNSLIANDLLRPVGSDFAIFLVREPQKQRVLAGSGSAWGLAGKIQYIQSLKGPSHVFLHIKAASHIRALGASSLVDVFDRDAALRHYYDSQKPSVVFAIILTFTL